MDERAQQARERVWERRPAMTDVVVRSGLIAHRGPSRSFLRSVSTPKGAAVQVLLLALFEAQSRRHDLVGRPTNVPLRPADRETQVSWRQLTALPTTDRTSRTSSSRQPEVNRDTQLRKALDMLHRAGRVGVEGTGRGRHEGFRLFDESVDNLVGEVPYSWPAADESVINIPVEFMINGWVHVLTDNEIITFLHLLQVCAEATDESNPQGWVAIPTDGWGATFGEDRSYEAYRELYRFGVIDIERPDARRADGTVAAGEERPWEAHRFRVLHDRLSLRAVDVVLSALEVKHSLDADEALFATGSTRHFTGWSRAAALERLQADRLAVPGQVLLK